MNKIILSTLCIFSLVTLSGYASGSADWVDRALDNAEKQSLLMAKKISLKNYESSLMIVIIN